MRHLSILSLLGSARGEIHWGPVSKQLLIDMRLFVGKLASSKKARRKVATPGDWYRMDHHRYGVEIVEGRVATTYRPKG